MKSIEDLWLEMSAGSGISGTFRRFDETHSLDLFAGFDLDGRRVLMLVANNAPPELPEAGIIEVSLTRRSDGRFNLLFRLGRPEYQELFGRLCQDLIEISRDSRPEDGTAVLLLRLDRWKRLLESGPRKGLSDLQLRGLFGELWFLKTAALASVGSLAAVHAWKGPLGAPQDFQLFDGLVEVKTILPGAHKVSISSAEQLEHGTAPMQLGVLVVDPTSGISVPTLIDEIRLQLAISSAVTEFDLRLAEMGYSVRQEHEQILFSIVEQRFYHVDEGFPSLTVSTIPPGISGLTYDVDLMQCGPYRSQYTHVVE
jgi:hypothetical protein